jgi:hypothetical protein
MDVLVSQHSVSTAPEGVAGPDFICIGAQKAGTQWLYDQLALHPEFWMPPIKELHYFDRAVTGFRTAKRLLKGVEGNLDKVNARRVKQNEAPLSDRHVRFMRNFTTYWRKDERGVDAYASLFAEKGRELTGDVTPGYSILDEEQIATVVGRLPGIKILFLVRDPVERLWSQVCQVVRKSKSGRAPAATPKSVIAFAQRRGVRGRSFPTEIVRRWQDLLPAGQFAYFFFDDLKRDPADLRRRILGYLGADAELASGSLEAGFNRKSKFAKMQLTEDVRAALIDYFADEIRTAARELGGPAVQWQRKYKL